MDLGIDQKIVIVTGGSKGIGEGITRVLADEGAIPIIASRSKQSGKDLVNELSSQGQESYFVEAELSHKMDCINVVRKTIAKYGRVDALINNAGVNDGIGLEAGNADKFEKSLHKNLIHYYTLAHHCLPHLIETQGAIVNISSKTAMTGQGGTSGYAAAKGAQLALTREWAVELLKYNIRVNAIVPAEVMTPLYKKWLDTFGNPDRVLSTILENIPLGNRMTTPSEIGSMAAYLISNRARHITGQHLYVDGGYVHLDRSILPLRTSPLKEGK